MDLSILTEAIHDIGELHSNFSENFIHTSSHSFDLKKKTVDNILESKKFDSSFLEHIEEYHSQLNYISYESNFEEKYSCWDSRTRVKQKDSIYNKLIFYGEKQENGKIPLQKCLNDLYGFRLIVDDFSPYNKDYMDYVESLKSDSAFWKCYNRDVAGYKGTHFYFKSGRNIFFPWELQIWNSIDIKTNEQAHKKHKAKRSYISWPQKYKDAEIEKG